MTYPCQRVKQINILRCSKLNLRDQKYMGQFLSFSFIWNFVLRNSTIITDLSKTHSPWVISRLNFLRTKSYSPFIFVYCLWLNRSEIEVRWAKLLRGLWRHNHTQSFQKNEKSVIHLAKSRSEFCWESSFYRLYLHYKKCKHMWQ